MFEQLRTFTESSVQILIRMLYNLIRNAIFTNQYNIMFHEDFINSHVNKIIFSDILN